MRIVIVTLLVARLGWRVMAGGGIARGPESRAQTKKLNHDEVNPTSSWFSSR
jgi:hypothetical protein